MMLYTIALCIHMIGIDGVPTAIEFMDVTLPSITLNQHAAYSIKPNSTSIIETFDILSKLHISNALKKVSRDNEWDTLFSVRVEQEYGKFLFILKQYGSPVVPSKPVDLLWHQHILETKTYFKDMKRIFGRYIHHQPSYTLDEKRETRNKFDTFAHRYELEFGSMPDDIWGNCQRKSVTCDECDGRCSQIQCDECESRDHKIGNDYGECDDCLSDCSGCNDCLTL